MTITYEECAELRKAANSRLNGPCSLATSYAMYLSPRDVIRFLDVFESNAARLKELEDFLVSSAIYAKLEAADARAEQAGAERDLLAREFAAMIEYPNLYAPRFLLDTKTAKQKHGTIADALLEWARQEARKSGEGGV
jgi:hypothetical protein